MTRYPAAKMPASFSGYKHLTVGDILPDATTKLYRRLFVSSRKKYIPVKDITEDKAGRELNAYLIHPDYIDKSTIPSEEIIERLEAKPAVRVVQYSAIARLRPTYRQGRPIMLNIITNLIGAIRRLNGKIVYLSTHAVHGVQNTRIRFPIGKVYSASRGLTPQWRKHMIARTGALALIMSAGILAYIVTNNASEPQVQPTNPTGSLSQPEALPQAKQPVQSTSATERGTSVTNSEPISSPTYTPQSTLSNMPGTTRPESTAEEAPPTTLTPIQVAPPVNTPTIQNNEPPQTQPIEPPTQNSEGLDGVITNVTDTVTDIVTSPLGN